jgi:hypothetical protein
MDYYECLPALIEMPVRLLDDEIDAGRYRGALLIARDCWEAAIKFCGIALYADLVGTVGPDHQACTSELVMPLIVKPPSMGDWLDFWLASSKLAVRLNATGALLVPELSGVLHVALREGGRLHVTATTRLLHQAVEWRNETIGHGACSHSLDSVKAWVVEQRSRLAEVLNALTCMRAIRVFGSSPAGGVVEWNVREQPRVAAAEPGYPYFQVWMQRDKQTRVLSPLLLATAQNSTLSLLTFDKVARGYFFLDYFLGTKVRFPVVPEIHEIEARLSIASRLRDLETFRQGRALSSTEQAYSGSVLRALEQIEFGSDLDRWYVKPTYILQALEDACAGLSATEGRGYFHLVGGPGTGKSWFIAKLNSPGAFSHAGEVISYHIRAGMRQNPELFIASLHEQVQAPEGHNVHGARIRLEAWPNPADAVAAFFGDVLAVSAQERLILAIDGLDELLDPEPGQLSILDFLPPPERLPDDVLVLISSRADGELRERARGFVEKIRSGVHGRLYRLFDISNRSDRHRSLLQDYLSERHGITDLVLLNGILDCCGGSFLLAALLGKLYSGNRSLDSANLLSDLAGVYDAYLGAKRQTLGEELFRHLHQRIVNLLAVSPEPLSLGRIADLLGLQEERVLFALFDIGELFSTVRERPGNSFSVVHLELSQYLLSRHALEIATVLREILESFGDEETTLCWLVDASNFLSQSGQSHLCLVLCEMLLEKLPTDNPLRLPVMRRRIDMIHISGEYERAAHALGELAEHLVQREGIRPDHPDVVFARVRQAHHLKFIAPVPEVVALLSDVLKIVPPVHEAYPEVLFMLHGSVACLADPGEEELRVLLELAENCRSSSNFYLLTRCLRRAADLTLAAGDAAGALTLATEAKTLAEHHSTRQSLYLNSTIGEIFRCQGDLARSRRYHNSTLEGAKARGVPGWEGHGALGIAEVGRMCGRTAEVLAALRHARDCYGRANGQKWGLIHADVAAFLATGERAPLLRSCDEARRLGYHRDVRYIESLLTTGTLDHAAHHGHFLLFP